MTTPLPGAARSRLSRLRARTYAGLAAVALLASGAVALAPAAGAAGNARVTVAPGVADPQYATKLQVSGSGFQSVKNGFGGIYVFFGWVDTKWRPSAGGESGVDYVYVQDSGAKDNRGFQRFVAYPGDPTGYAANGGVLAADGTWSTTLIVPGATFPARGRSGKVEQVNCLKVQCGIITIGGHGVVNANNETFTPISFAGGAAAPTPSVVTAPPASAAPAAVPTTTAPAAQPVVNTPSASPPVAVSAEPVASVRTSTSVSVPKVVIAIALIFIAVTGTVLLRRRRLAKRGQA